MRGNSFPDENCVTGCVLHATAERTSNIVERARPAPIASTAAGTAAGTAASTAASTAAGTAASTAATTAATTAASAAT